jgi:hypothetical protein
MVHAQKPVNNTVIVPRGCAKTPDVSVAIMPMIANTNAVSMVVVMNHVNQMPIVITAKYAKQVSVSSPEKVNFVPLKWDVAMI